MRRGLWLASASLAIALLGLGNSPSWADDDGAAPLWEGISSIFGWGGKENTPIDYREHGKIVVPPKMDLPPPGAPPAADASAGAWPVDQEVQRKKAQKDEAAKQQRIAGVGDARLRYTHPFDPNSPVTVRAVDPQGNEIKCPEGNCGSAPSPLGSLNPLNWVGLGKTVPLGPEPDREWLTDPPKGFRAPVEGSAGN
jgi:hypothetical protein